VPAAPAPGQQRGGQARRQRRQRGRDAEDGRHGERLAAGRRRRRGCARAPRVQARALAEGGRPAQAAPPEFVGGCASRLSYTAQRGNASSFCTTACLQAQPGAACSQHAPARMHRTRRASPQSGQRRGRTRLDAHGVHVHAAAVQALDKVLLQHRPEPLRAWRPAPSASRAGSGSLTSTHTATAGRRAGGRAGTRDPPDYSAYLPSCTIERRRCSAGDRPRRATAAVQGRLRSLCLRRAAVPRRAAARPSLAGRQTQLARRRTSNSLSSTTTSK